MKSGLKYSNLYAIRISLASPDKIRSWSYGEVLKPTTINYKTKTPDPDGLFCEKIFGPIRDYECSCRKYKGKRYQDIICERCKVQVLPSSERRRRMGHINLEYPAVHPWFLTNSPKYISTLLGISSDLATKVTYHSAYYVSESTLESVPPKTYISEQEYKKIKSSLSEKDFIHTLSGAEAIQQALKDIDIISLSRNLRSQLSSSTKSTDRKRLAKRIKAVEAFFGTTPPDLVQILENLKKILKVGKEKLSILYDIIDQAYLCLEDWDNSATDWEKRRDVLFVKVNYLIDRVMSLGVPKDYIELIIPWRDPAWMVLEVIPVIPPELRPIMFLPSGVQASSDLNELYRRVVTRNLKLRKLKNLLVPDVILRNEKILLQHAVDMLFQGPKATPGSQSKTNRKQLKCLSDILKGKSGRLRRNLLGKRVDFSGRTVIVAGPELRLHQCGLPKWIALELFRPFVYQQLLASNVVRTVRSARILVESRKDIVWDVLEHVVKEHPVILNRAPTLHRLGIQAFEAVLVEGHAIRLHPLVCTAFNADFDGDQMAVHLPLSIEAQVEARVLMMSTNNIFSPANGKPIITPAQDIVLGIYYLTGEEEPSDSKKVRIFSDEQEVRCAYDAGIVRLHERILVRYGNERIMTTVGRVLFREITPSNIPVFLTNKTLTKKDLLTIINEVYRRNGEKSTIVFCDKVKDLGYEYATKAGISICIDNLSVSPEKKRIIESALSEVANIKELQKKRKIPKQEHHKRIIEVWTQANEDVSNSMLEILKKESTFFGDERDKEKNFLYMMVDSGARGSNLQIRQLAGMRGLIAKPTGEIVETPIISNFREGMSVLDYFISTHGARKGLADTALKTANSGYLTRRLVDASQSTIVTIEDCKTQFGIEVKELSHAGEKLLSLSERVLGRVLCEPICNPSTGQTIVPSGSVIDESAIKVIEALDIKSVKVRSVITCEAIDGVCRQCYGWDLSRRNLVEIGVAVGIIAAQSIGEPGTQLTMRTFHIGGTAAVQRQSVKAKEDGIAKIIKNNGKICGLKISQEYIIEKSNIRECIAYPQTFVRKGVFLFDSPQREILPGERYGGRVEIHEDNVVCVIGEDYKFCHVIPSSANILVEDGDYLLPNQALYDQSYESNRRLYPFELRGGNFQILSEDENTITISLSEHYPVASFMKCIVKDGDIVKKGQKIIEWVGEGKHCVTSTSYGKVSFRNISYVTDSQGDTIVTNNGGHICIVDELNTVKEKYRVYYGSYLYVNDGDNIEPSRLLFEWDEHWYPTITTASGYVSIDTNTSSPKEKGARKSSARYANYEISIVDKDGNPKEKHIISNEAHLLIENGAKVQSGTIIAETFRRSLRSKDITGGLPRIIEIFEARKPSTPAIMSDIDGTVTIQKKNNWSYSITVSSENMDVQYPLPQFVPLLARDGDQVEAGDLLSIGQIDLHDLLRTKGKLATACYIIDSLQSVYASQGVRINDVHFEVIVRQMTKRVQITDPGDSRWTVGDQVTIQKFNKENEKLLAANKKQAKAQPVLLGITKASLAADDSFISMASFQETLTVLTQAAASGAIDFLTGLKENVIVGRMIPAGTGLDRYKRISVHRKLSNTKT